MKRHINQSQLPTPLFDLEDELALRMGRTQSVMDALAQLQVWAGTTPYLINLLGHQLIECLPLAVSGKEKRLLDELVQRKVIEDWRQNTAADHLCEIESTLLSYPQVDSLLILYLKVLQRGETEVEDSPEQSVLIASGLVVRVGDLLKVASAIYESVFDLAWLEKQVPGLTKPVSIMRSSNVLQIEGSRRLQPAQTPPAASDCSREGHPGQPAPETKLYSKTMVLACCMSVVVAILTTYAQESNQPSLAASAETASAKTVDAELVQAVAIAPPTEKQRFDNGTEHATNGRWLMMMREFCQIPNASAYFEPAKRNMSKWMTLYKEDIEVAKTAFTKEGNPSCKVMP